MAEPVDVSSSTSPPLPGAPLPSSTSSDLPKESSTTRSSRSASFVIGPRASIKERHPSLVGNTSAPNSIRKLRSVTFSTPANRVTPPSPEVLLKSATKYLSTFDTSANPEPEDKYYRDSPTPSKIVSQPALDKEKDKKSAPHPILAHALSMSMAPDMPSPIPEEKEDGSEASPTKIEENVCTGCGTPPVASFVALIPCDHVVCPPCLNGLINAAAHVPPRALTCYCCTKPVDSFGPAFEVGPLLPVLAESLARGEARRQHHVSPKTSYSSPLGLKTKFQGQPSSHSDGSQARRPSMTSEKGSGSDYVYERRESFPETPIQGGSRASTGSFSLGGSPVFVDTSDFSSLAAKLDWATEMASQSPTQRYSHPNASKSSATKSISSANFSSFSPESSKIRSSPGQSDSYQHYGHSKEFSSASATGTFRSPVPPEVLKHIKEPIDWPVVRLDNIPWDVSVADVEQWLPRETLAPLDECVLAVHILCNRVDGRTLNQCYLEACTIQDAREIVRQCDGKKLRGRPVHVTISDQGELMSTIFPSWEPGFDGLEARQGAMAGPLIMQTELTGLVSLCKLNVCATFRLPLESWNIGDDMPMIDFKAPHAGKVKERPYFNIVTVIQKFPWHQLETYNSKQIVRLYTTALAAVEVMRAIRTDVPEWSDILTVFSDAVVACPVFRPAQKSQLIKLTGLRHARFPDLVPSSSREFPKRHDRFFAPSLGDHIVTVGGGVHPDDGSPPPSEILDFAPRLHAMPSTSSFSLRPPPQPRLSKALSTPNFSLDNVATNLHKGFDGSPKKLKGRKRIGSIAKTLGIEVAVVLAVAEQLGCRVVA